MGQKMKVTTVRFGEDLWATISAEAERAGVSASQFIREAALARAAAAAGARGLSPFEMTADPQGAPIEAADAAVEPGGAAIGPAGKLDPLEVRAAAMAVRAQSKQARRFAVEKRQARSLAARLPKRSA